ncbi:YhjD/YihY/BrkB family envelope integrity protein [Dermatophilaceae bacterium Soc4.6]
MKSLLKPIMAVWTRIQATKGWKAWSRFGESRGNLLAAGIAFYGFFSVFPAAALAAAVFGLVLRGRPDLVASLTTAASSSLPGVIKTSARPDGLIALSAPSVSVVTVSGLVGLVGLVLAGTGWVGALRDGIRTVFGMSGAPGNVVTVKLRDLGVFASLGLAVVLSAVLTSASGALGGIFEGVLGATLSRLVVGAVGILVGLAVDFGVMLVLLRVLSGVPLSYRDLRAGALVGAVGQGIVKIFAVALIANATKNPLLGSVTLVIGLLFWLNLIAKLILVGAAWAANDAEVELSRLEALTGESVSDDEVRAYAVRTGRDAALGSLAPAPPPRGALSVVTPTGAPAIAARRGQLPRGREARIAAADARASERLAAADTASRRGRATAGLPDFGQRAQDRTTITAGAVLGATVAIALASAGRTLRAVTSRRD